MGLFQNLDYVVHDITIRHKATDALQFKMIKDQLSQIFHFTGQVNILRTA